MARPTAIDRFTASDGVDLVYRRWGEGSDRPPVLLHHGFIANATLNWLDPGVVGALVDDGREVVAHDARGHGGSDHPHDPAVFDAMPMDRAGQVVNAFHHLDLALQASGCERHDVVNMIRFFSHVDEDQDVVNKYQKEWFGGHIPTSTTVEVVRFATDPRLRFEFHVVAAAPGA